MIIESTAKYLRAIYQITQNSEVASTKSIAELIGYSKPSVTRKIQAMAKDSYLNYDFYRGVTLTEKGEKAALKERRRQFLLETFLVRILKYSRDQAHIESLQMEYAISNQFIDKVEELLRRSEIDQKARYDEPDEFGAGKML